MKNPCTTPTCRGRVDTTSKSGKCDRCKAAARRDTDRARGTATQRGYGNRWRQAARDYFASHPYCCLCEAEGVATPATVRDHHPASRKELLAKGVPDPDQWQYLRPLCRPCHSKETARHQPGGWNARKGTP